MPPARQPSRRHSALANTVFGFVSLALTLVTGIVFVPLYLGYVGAPAYGAWLASGNVLAWLSIIDPGIGDLSRQRVAELLGAGRWRDVCSTLLCGTLVMTGLSIAVAAIGIAFADAFIGVLRLPDAALRLQTAHAFRLACVGTALTLIGNYLAGAVQGLQVSVSLGLVGIVTALSVPIVRIALLHAGFCLDGFAWALVVQGILMCAGCAVLLVVVVRRQQRGFAWSFHEFGSLFSLSLFTGLTRIAGTISNNFVAVLIARSLGPTATVNFEMTRQPMEMARTLLDKPASSFLPAFSHLRGANETDKMRTYAIRYMRYLSWTLGLAVAGFASLNRLFLDLWVGDEFYAGPLVNGLLLAGLATAAIGNTSRLLLFAFGRIRYTAITSLIETVMFMIAAVLGIRWFGLPGLAAASIVVFLTVGMWLKTGTLLREYLGHGSLAELARCVVPSAIAAALTAWATAAVVGRVPGLHHWSGLALLAFGTTALYAAVLFTLSAEIRLEARAVAGVLADRRRLPARHDSP